MEELINPVEERKNGADESPYLSPGGDKEIIQQVVLEQNLAKSMTTETMKTTRGVISNDHKLIFLVCIHNTSTKGPVRP